MPSWLRAGIDGALPVRLAWLTGLRLIVVTVFLIVTTTSYMGGFVPGGFSNQVSLVLVVSAYCLAAVYALVLRAGKARRYLAYVQLLSDTLIWTAIIYVAGGVAGGATFLYGLGCLSGAILLGVRGAAVAYVASVTCLVTLATALGFGWIPRPPDQPPGLYLVRWPELTYPLFVNLLGITLVALLAGFLAERLRKAGGRLAAATARAENAERLAALGRLAAGLAHEIRNPLGSIAGSIELMRTGGKLSPEDDSLCEIIERETTRLNDLVTDMLNLSRPRTPSREPVDLSSLAREVLVLAARSGRGSDVRVRYEGPESALIDADAAQMRQVIWNLVRNAIQASSAGDDVVVRLLDSEGCLLLQVSDSGPGIPEGARERLFDAFFTTRSQGMGIGLAVVKRVLDDHGFSIEVRSSGERGTTFEIEIRKDSPSEADLPTFPPPTISTIPPWGTGNLGE